MAVRLTLWLTSGKLKLLTKHHAISVRLQYGSIGSAGRTTDKDFADAAAAGKYVTQQNAAKKKKGYVEKVQLHANLKPSPRTAASTKRYLKTDAVADAAVADAVADAAVADAAAAFHRGRAATAALPTLIHRAMTSVVP